MQAPEDTGQMPITKTVAKGWATYGTFASSLPGDPVVVKIMDPFWIPIIIRHLISRVPKKGPEF